MHLCAFSTQAFCEHSDSSTARALEGPFASASWPGVVAWWLSFGRPTLLRPGTITPTSFQSCGSPPALSFLYVAHLLCGCWPGSPFFSTDSVHDHFQRFMRCDDVALPGFSMAYERRLVWMSINRRISSSSGLPGQS